MAQKKGGGPGLWHRQCWRKRGLAETWALPSGSLRVSKELLVPKTRGCRCWKRVPGAGLGARGAAGTESVSPGGGRLGGYPSPLYKYTGRVNTWEGKKRLFKQAGTAATRYKLVRSNFRRATGRHIDPLPPGSVPSAGARHGAGLEGRAGSPNVPPAPSHPQHSSLLRFPEEFPPVRGRGSAALSEAFQEPPNPPATSAWWQTRTLIHPQIICARSFSSPNRLCISMKRALKQHCSQT